MITGSDFATVFFEISLKKYKNVFFNKIRQGSFANFSLFAQAPAANDSCRASCHQDGLQRSAKPSEQTLYITLYYIHLDRAMGP